MKRFYIESGIKVCEYEEFEKRILDQTQEFHFTPEQWKNRRQGRTHIKPQERLAMMAIVEDMRKRPEYRSQTTRTNFIKN